MNQIKKIEVGKIIACIYLDPEKGFVESISHYIVIKEFDFEMLQNITETSELSKMTEYLLKEKYIQLNTQPMSLQ